MKLKLSPLSAGMWAPGIVGLVIGVLLLFFVSDSPEKNGYPPVEVVKKKVSSWLLMLLCWYHCCATEA